MKKILFLSFAYPYGHYGPSDNCTVRVIEALSANDGFDVYNVSGAPHNNESKPSYKLLNNIQLLYLPFPEKQSNYSYLVEHILLFLKIPFYPLVYPLRVYQYFRACKKILKHQKFDIVISQCAPLESVITGALLKKHGIINKHMVFYWDNIYGKLPHRIIPKWFANYRRKSLENWVARYADKLISPIPVKSFHEQYGDVLEATGKRVYLGHPSIVRPKMVISILKDDFVVEGMINILYAGRVYDFNDIVYSIKLLNTLSFANRINLIFFFYKRPSEEEMCVLTNNFIGKVHCSGCVPFEELMSLYPFIDAFVGYAGVDTSQVISKLYDYMCYGKPIIYFYKSNDDVNLKEFMQYPLFNAFEIGIPLAKNNKIEVFLSESLGHEVPFEMVEALYPQSTVSSYIDAIKEVLEQV